MFGRNGCCVSFQRMPLFFSDFPVLPASPCARMQHAMKKPRSLKVDIPPAAELARARREILERLKLHDPERDKIKLACASEAERQREEEIVEEITKQLQVQKGPKEAPVYIYNVVVLACCSVETAKQSTKPIVVEEITTELVAAARELLRILGKQDLPAFYKFTVFHTVPNWNQFIGHLENLTKLRYRKPPRNFDPVKRACAVMAWLLITQNTVATPTGTQGGLFRTIAGLLHQFIYPTADGVIADLKTACDEVLKDVRRGCNLEAERW
jgi:hypothetical protein